MALGFNPAIAPSHRSDRRSDGGPFKFAGVLNPALILDGLCLYVLSSFQRTGSCLPLVGSAVSRGTFQLYGSQPGLSTLNFGARAAVLKGFPDRNREVKKTRRCGSSVGACFVVIVANHARIRTSQGTSTSGVCQLTAPRSAARTRAHSATPRDQTGSASQSPESQ